MLPLLAATILQGPVIELKPGMTITQSCRIKPGVYRFDPPSDGFSKGAIKVEGNNITVDFQDAELHGSALTAEPDERKGLGVMVLGRNVRIHRAKVRGYKVGMLARGVLNLQITDSDFSWNWKQRLASTIEREDLADWMSYHKNEKDEWLRYGAGIYLRNCDRMFVKGVTIEGGQNGLLMTDSDYGSVVGCNFSFLSSLGIGMYRSSGNLIQQNNIDWCVRGYSHGVYNRGQDSAGILIYEQSHKNVFAFNSVTHGGDGFFLWAGQTTMDTGKGGCNDNLLVGNDFSHAPTNGIEATFSRNAFVENLIAECWHGIWGGYGYDSLTIGNLFAHNADGIAWEHGQNNTFEGNWFYRDRTAVRLWQNASEAADWGYPKNRDTRSRDAFFRRNTFQGIGDEVFNLGQTAGVVVDGNRFIRINEILKTTKEQPGLKFQGNFLATNRPVSALANGDRIASGFNPEIDEKNVPMPNTMQPSGNVIQGLDPETKDYLARFDLPWEPTKARRFQDRLRSFSRELPSIPTVRPDMPLPFLKKGGLRGRRYILVDQWGPYDFRTPLLWPRSTTGNKTRFEILGPVGTWRVKSVSPGIKLSQSSGSVPGTVEAEVGQSTGDINIQLTYSGGRTVDYRGIAAAPGTQVGFGWSKFNLPIEWFMTLFNYEKGAEDPRTNYDAWKAKGLKGGVTSNPKEINFAWGGSPGAGLTNDSFGTFAAGSFTAPAGDYELNVTSDDGVRVWIDDKLVIENWTYHGPTLDKAKVKLGGKHVIRLEHFELDGYSALKVEFKPIRRP